MKRAENRKATIFDDDGMRNLYVTRPNRFFPFEARIDMNIVKARQKYTKIQILGCLDSTKITKGKKEIDQELETKPSFMLQHMAIFPALIICYFRRCYAKT